MVVLQIHWLRGARNSVTNEKYRKFWTCQTSGKLLSRGSLASPLGNLTQFTTYNELLRQNKPPWLLEYSLAVFRGPSWQFVHSKRNRCHDLLQYHLGSHSNQILLLLVQGQQSLRSFDKDGFNLLSSRSTFFFQIRNAVADQVIITLQDMR